MGTVQIILLCVGGLAMLLGVLIAIRRIRTVYFGASAEGHVVGQSESTMMRSSRSNNRPVTLYAPIVEFQHAGKRLRFTSSMGVAEKMAEGSSVPVRFLPNDPENSAEIATPGRMWGFPIAALGVGGVFVVLALLLEK